MKSSCFHHYVPDTLSETLALLRRHADDDCRIIAGGQSLVPMMALRMAQPTYLIDINNLDGLDTISVGATHISIPALVRHSAFRRPVCHGPLGALMTRVARHIAHFPIRTRGTFCGSLAHADPASEWCLLMVTLDGEIEIESGDGSRLVAADEFFSGLMTTTIAPGEMIVGARIPLMPSTAHCGFYEFSRRPGDYAIAMALIAYDLVEGTLQNVRIGVGAVEERPRRIPDAEHILCGRTPTRDSFLAAGKAAAAMLEPMEDLQADADYRRHLAQVVVCRALEQAL
jgi:carbon-monoxide dehydrogenase medium subunit